MKSCDIKFRINEEGYLLVSCDKGCTWENIGMVKGDASTVQGPQGEQGPQGPSGADGANGADGNTPYINELTGTWWIGTTDTGVVAEGANGEVDIEGSSDIAVVGTPSVTKRVVGNKTILKFHELKGERGDAPEITAERVDATNSVIFSVDGVPVVTLYDGIRYAAGTYIEITPIDNNHSTIACTLTGGEGVTINENNEICLTLQVPTVKNELIYSDDNETLTTHQLLYQDALVVDNDPDFTACTQLSDIDNDILGAWHQFSLYGDTSGNPNHSPEYANGLYITGSTSYPNTGYGMWYTDTNGKVLNAVNSGDFNGYMIPRDKESYLVESLFGTDLGNTSGDQIGFSIINDSNALPRHFSTENGVYYRNTLYDIYPSGTTSSTYPKRPAESAWVKEDVMNNTAKVIYTTSPASANATESFPTGTVSVYSISNIKTSAGRRNRVLEGTETVVANSAKEASGYLGVITVVVTNSNGMELVQGTGDTGTIYVFGSVYDILTKSWKNTTIIDGRYSQREVGDYWNKGYWLVPYDSTLNTSSVAAVIKNSVSYNNGILKMRFGNAIAYSSSDSAAYNGSELTINFKTRTYDFTPYTGATKGGIVLTAKTGVALPTFTATGVKDKDGQSVSPDLWGMFVGATKFAYNAYSYNNLFIKCLDLMIDNTIFYVDKTSVKYGVWRLNAARTAYEKQYISGVAEDPLDYFGGSRQSYNTITKKLFYNDGTSIYQIAGGEEAVHYTAGDNISINGNVIAAKLPKTNHELIYFDSSKESNPYKGLFSQQLMYEDGIVVDNQTDYAACAIVPSAPDIQDTFQQFSESPYCPEYSNGLSLNQYAHVSPYWGSTGGYGYNSWSASQSGNVISTDKNSEEFNGYIYPHKVHKIEAESLIGAYRGSTSGDIETITLLNSNHATPRCVRTTDGRTFYRNSMYDLEGSSGTPNYCAWVYKPNNTAGAYIIYSPSEAITSSDVENGLYWSVSGQSNWNPSTGKLTKVNATTGPGGTSSSTPPLNNLTTYFKDAFPVVGNTYTVYYASAVDTLAHRRSTTSSGTVTISENAEASGYLAALHILISNTRDINSIFLYGSSSICGTVLVYSEILPISGLASPTKECTDAKTLFSFVKTSNSSSSSSSPSYNGIDAYGMFPFKHQRRYFITVNKADCWSYSGSSYTKPSTINSSLTSGDKLLPFNQSYDMCNNNSKAIAVLSKFSLQDGVIKLNLSKLGASSSSGSLSTFEDIDNFYEAGTESSEQTALEYTDAELVIDFRNRKYSMIAADGTVVADGLDLVSYEDNLTVNDGDSIQRTGDTKYNVTVVENGVEKEIDICSLFTEEVQFMYGTTSLQYHALNCVLLLLNDKLILRADDNTVWKLNSSRTAYIRDTEHTALDLLKGSRLNFNDITKKLWYSNGSRIYQIGGSFS